MSGIQQLIKDGRAASKAAVRMAILEVSRSLNGYSDHNHTVAEAIV
jgi:hypothetical protein